MQTATPARACYFKTAMTVEQIGKIAANTYVCVNYAYTESTTGLKVYTISTALFNGIVEEDVLETQLTRFCL